MGGIGKTVAVAMAAMAFAGMAPAMSPIEANPTTVAKPLQTPQQQAPAQQSAANEIQRVARLGGVSTRWRKMWDGKNRSPGDRANKRWKRARATGKR